MTHAGACACACAGVRQTMRSRSPVTITAGQTLIDSSFFYYFFPCQHEKKYRVHYNRSEHQLQLSEFVDSVHARLSC